MHVRQHQGVQNNNILTVKVSRLQQASTMLMACWSLQGNWCDVRHAAIPSLQVPSQCALKAAGRQLCATTSRTDLALTAPAC